MAEKWSLEGTIFEACNCHSAPCPCAFFRDPTGSDCRTVAVLHIEKGKMGSTTLDGLHAALIAYATGYLMKGIDKAGFILDEAASSDQRRALLSIFGGQAGGFFGEFGKLVKNNLGVKYAKFQYHNDGKSWSASAGKMLEVKGGIVKAPPGLGVETTPKKSETYDFFYGPSMEKILGTSEYFRSDLDGLEFDISDRNSASGKFRYQGP